MNAIMIRENGGPGGNKVSSVFIVFGCGVWESLCCDRSETLSLFDDGADVREIRFVRELRETMLSDDPVEFFMCLFDDMRERHGRKEE
jgi:hypothetical protein